MGTYRGTKAISGLFKIGDISTENVVAGIKDVIENYEESVIEMRKVRLKYDWSHVCEKLAKYYHFALKVNEEYTSEKSKELYTKVYNETIHHV